MNRVSAILWFCMVGLLPLVTNAEDPAPFAVLEFRVRGNTLLDASVIERATYPSLGPGKTIADLDRARASLEQAYRDAGYPTVFVDLPEQQVDAGIVVLAVTEGRIGRVRISGSRYFSNGWIREQLPEATSGRVPRLASFQSEITALNARSPDRSLTPILRPGAQPGTVDIELKVQDELPVHGSLELNNRNSAETSATRLNAAVRYDNLWQREHSVGLNYQVAPENSDDTEVFIATYSLKPKSSPNTFVIYGVKSDSNIATVGGNVNVLGKGEIYGFRAALPLPAGEALYHSVLLGLDYKNFDETIGFDAEGMLDIETPISYLQWSVAWNGTLTGEGRTQSFSAGLNFGIRGLGNSSAEFADKRFKGRPNYSYLAASYELNQMAWRQSSLVWRLGAQLTAQPLITNEQFSAGGLDSVRGYFEAEQLGDYGVRSALEWRTPGLPVPLLTDEKFYAFLFADAASLWIKDAQASQDDTFSIASAGIGLRLNWVGLSAGLDWAWPFRAGSATAANDDRWLFSLRYGF